MSSQSVERRTINIPSTRDQPATVPCYDLEDRTRSSLQSLQEGDLLQLAVDHGEELFQFVSVDRDVTLESLSHHLNSADPKNVALYRCPISKNTVLIWTRCPTANSAKRMRVQNRVRRDLTWYAGEEGIQNIVTVGDELSCVQEDCLSLYSCPCDQRKM
ncbi:unnamed protein product [Fusarium graminearum]|uniref:Chromosome 1, complete genome n=1 Tax=Gibberella zeae (strain ATCC MYA-4620 / CBS 123657 / FGSC 9075 / NRRL 31084 / PH-1) TaxID=229533 RepID=A0A098DCE2_GIBZE|nr:unnamed protein product [Fusarium graminearum]